MFNLAKVSPSIIAIDYNDEEILNKNIKLLEENNVKMLHVDVMDGVFVPNFTFDCDFVKKLRKKTTLLLDCHLMVENPENQITKFAEAGADIITVHFEACKDLEKTLQEIRRLNCLAGVAINPDTDVKKVEKIIKDGLADVVLIMSVIPGRCGQKYIVGSEEKVFWVKSLGTNIKVEVDGGVNGENAELLRLKGADILVSGSYIFNSNTPTENIKLLEG